MLSIVTFFGVGVGIMITLFLSEPTWASHEPFGVYEDWSSLTIRSDRWRGGEAFGTPLNPMGEPTMGVATEARREIDAGTLRMRYRREGGRASNVGAVLSVQLMDVTHPLLVDQLEATFTVDDPVTVTDCPANPTASRARAARLLIERLNNGQGADIIDRTGDLFAVIQAHRDSDSPDLPGVLQVLAFLNRCDNANCAFSTTLINMFLPSVTVGIPFRLRVIWDAPNSRFLFGVDDSPDAPLTYDPAIFFREARLPFAGTHLTQSTANCVAGPTVVDSANRVGELRTNTSAIIP